MNRALDATALQRLQQAITASEQGHDGQIRLCVEAALPWRYLRGRASPRDRALTMFAKLRVWDTEHNNGVLIYLLLAERRIEIVADRALARAVPPEVWRAMTAHMGEAFRAGRWEDGLTQALSEVTALLAAHFPAPPHGQDGPGNELPDAPVLARGWADRGS